MKRKHLLRLAVAAILFFSAISGAFAQGMAVNTSGTAADTSAMLDVASTSKGILVPRMTTAQRNAIVTPATGLMIFQTDGTAGFYYYTGSAWTAVGGGGGSSSGVSQELAYTFTTASTTIGTSSNITMLFNNAITTPTIGSYSTSTGVYTVGSAGAGLYLITCSIACVSTNAAVSPSVLLNSSTVAVGGNAASSGFGTYLGRSSVSTVLSLVAGDAIKIQGYNNNITTTATISTDGSTRLTITKLN